jgi:hypothetical protein
MELYPICSDKQYISVFKILMPVMKSKSEVFISNLYWELAVVFTALASEERDNVIARVCMSVRMSVCVSPNCVLLVNFKQMIKQMCFLISGSRAGAIIAACWATLMSNGRQGYVDATRKIVETTRHIAAEYVEFFVR